MKLFVLFPHVLLSGCVVGTVAKTAVDVVTLPVKAVSAGVDAATTSQSEADEKRGREARKADEERGRQARELAERCRKGRPLPSDDPRQRNPDIRRAREVLDWTPKVPLEEGLRKTIGYFADLLAEQAAQSQIAAQ